MVDNIVIGTPLIELEKLGVLESETTVHFPFNDDGTVFLPSILKQAGLFKSTSEIKQIDAQRNKSGKIKDPLERQLWRKINQPEMTPFKVGKKVFWLIVGE